MIEQALLNEPETYEQRKVRLAREVALARQREKINEMEAFINARGKQVCKGFTTSHKLVTYDINRKATIVGFIEDNTDSRIQVRISGYRIENKKLQDIFLSDDLEYKGSKVVSGNLIWDQPTGWSFCNK